MIILLVKTKQNTDMKGSYGLFMVTFASIKVGYR